MHACKFTHVPLMQLQANLDQPAHRQHRANDATEQVQVEREHGDHPGIVWILPLQLSALSAQVLQNIKSFGLLH